MKRHYIYNGACTRRRGNRVHIVLKDSHTGIHDMFDENLKEPFLMTDITFRHLCEEASTCLEKE